MFEQISKILQSKSLFESLAAHQTKKDTERCPFFVWCIELNEEGNPDGFPFKLSFPSDNNDERLYIKKQKCYYFSIVLLKRGNQRD